MDIFKKPKELDMTEAEVPALIAVMHQMESGEIVYQPPTQSLFMDDKPAGPKAFNINAAGAVSGEGQIGCIGFYMGIEMGMSPLDARDYIFKQQQDTTKLAQLLWGNLDANLKPDMVAKTIRNFLQTGVVDWQVGYLTQDNH